MILAIIDLGSNSVRMDIVEIDEASGNISTLTASGKWRGSARA